MAIRTVRGVLTSEGVTCQAMRSDTGELFTLVGDLAGFKTGDRVIVIGTEAAVSICMQGTTLGILSITADVRPQTDGPEMPFPLAQRGSAQPVLGRGNYRCVRLGDYILLSAEGTLANLNDRPALEQMPWRIWPPRFGLLVYPAQVSLPATRPFKIWGLFGYPRSATSVGVVDADGEKAVPVEALAAGSLLSTLDSESTDVVRTGYSTTSLQEAFEAAVAQLPASNPAVPDGFVTYTVKRSGLHRGGFAGVRVHFMQVEASFGVAPGRKRA